MLWILTELITAAYIDQHAYDEFTQGKIILKNKTSLHLETYYNYQLSLLYSTTGKEFRALHYNSDGALFGIAGVDNSYVGNYYFCPGPLRVKPATEEDTEVNFQVISFDNIVEIKDNMACTYITVLSDISTEATYESVGNEKGNQCFWIVSPEAQTVTITPTSIPSTESFYFAKLEKVADSQYFTREKLTQGKEYETTQNTTFFYFTRNTNKVTFKLKGSHTPAQGEPKIQTRYFIDYTNLEKYDPCFVAPNLMTTEMPENNPKNPVQPDDENQPYDPDSGSDHHSDYSTSWWAICFYVICGIVGIVFFLFTGKCICCN